jgi:hypothetical protein
MKPVEKKITYESDNKREMKISEQRARGELFRESSFDYEALVIRNVSLLGAESANGYTYTEAAMKDAAKLLEGAVQYLNHSFDDGIPRDVLDVFSEVKNPRYEVGKNKVYGDMYLVNTPQIREEVLPRIERFKHKFGNSIVAMGEAEEIEGKTYITKLSGIESCDLVSDPATTKGLFESIANKPNSPGGGTKMEFSVKDVKENKEVYDELKSEILKEIKDGQTLDTLIKKVDFLEGENKKLKIENDNYKRDRAIEEKAKLIEKEIKEAKIPAIAVTETWKSMLLDKDEIDIKKAVSELAESVQKLTEASYNYEKNMVESLRDAEDRLPDEKELDRIAATFFN